MLLRFCIEKNTILSGDTVTSRQQKKKEMGDVMGNQGKKSAHLVIS